MPKLTEPHLDLDHNIDVYLGCANDFDLPDSCDRQTSARPPARTTRSDNKKFSGTYLDG